MTDEEFGAWWIAISAALDPGTTIQHWSAAKGEIPGSFVVTGIDDTCVRIEGRQDDELYQRMIHRSDFRRVLDVWEPYCLRRVLRKQINSMTMHSTYVIGIIHWMDSK